MYAIRFGGRRSARTTGLGRATAPGRTVTTGRQRPQ
jgi:hypothetical protein